MGKEEAERGVGRGDKEGGQRIARLNYNSERKAKRKEQKEVEGGESHLQGAQGRRAGLCTSGGDTHHMLLSDLIEALGCTDGSIG